MVSTTPCPPSEDLQRFLLGQLTETEAECLEHHLAACRRCVARLQAAQPHDGLMDLVAHVARDGATPPAEVDQALLDSLYRLRHGLADVVDATTWADRPSARFSAATPLPGRVGPSPLHHGTDLADFLGPPVEPGELGRFGPYRIVRILGAGGMGMVFEARQGQPQRTVALKMILPGPRGWQRLARFRSEAEIIARLAHPNIVPIYEVGEHAGRPYFTMEHVDGGSLAQKLAMAPLPSGEAAELVETLARAVQFAHERGTVHRDLKPANVLLSNVQCSSSQTGGFEHRPLALGHWTPKITDFGLAKQFEGESDPALAANATESGAILGTPAYMAPEQASGGPNVPGPAVDIYALGAILYEALTCRPPFRSATLLETLEQVRNQEPLPPSRLQPGLSRDLQTICLKCLAKEPPRRYASAQALADDLGRFRRGEPIHARPVNPAERLFKWARRHPAQAALVGVCILAMTGMIAGAAAYEQRLRSSLEETAAQRERANANYRQTRDTLRRILDYARTRHSEGVPKLRELQRQQQEEALAFFLHMAEQQGDDPEVRYDVAGVYLEAADIQGILGQPQDALRNRYKARDLFAALIAESPQRPRYRYGHVQSLLAIARMSPGTLLETGQCLQQALEEISELTRAEPEKIEYRIVQAQTHHQLGIRHYEQKQFSDAEDQYRQAAGLAEELSREQPEVRQHRVLLANTQINLSLLLQQNKRDPRESHDRAEAVLEQLQREQLNDEEVLNSLATVRLNWAYVQEAKGQPEAALAELAKNVKLLEEALRQEPQHAKFHDLLWRTYGVRRLILENQKRYAEAVEAGQQVVHLSRDPATADFQRLFLAKDHADAGQHAHADQVLVDWSTRITRATPADHLLHALNVYCTALETVRRDERLSSTERDALTERYGSRAVALVRKLQEHGYFEDGKKAEGFRTDPDLQPLRDRPDFQKLFQGKDRAKPE
jgi:serine/threonine protein kinase